MLQLRRAGIWIPFASAFVLSNAATTYDPSSDPLSLSNVLAQHANLSSFRSLLHDQFPALLTAGDTKFDASENPITILAPSNHGFDQIPYTAPLQDWFKHNTSLQVLALLSYHVLDGIWTNATLNGSFAFPHSLTSGTNFSQVTGGQRVGAVRQGGQPSELVFTSGRSTRPVVTLADIPFRGGYIQMIDNFLIPPVPVVDTADTYQLSNEPSSLTSFIGSAYSLGNTPLKSNNMSLASYFNQTQDLTLFIPVNYAMEITSGALLSMDNNTLLDLLSYHVLAVPRGPFYSSNFSDGLTLPTLQGTNIRMTFNSNSYFVNSARILTSDVLVYNGVFHIIDNVLDPNVTNAKPNPTSATQVPVLPTTGIANFNASMAPFTTFNPDWAPTSTSRSSTATSIQPTSQYNGFSTGSAVPSSTLTSNAAATRVQMEGPLNWLGPFSGIALLTALACLIGGRVRQ